MFIKSFLLSMALVSCLLSSSAFGAIGLSVNPNDGSNTLRLQQPVLGLAERKEVHVRISSTEGKQYQVFARMLEPMVNEKGESLALRFIQCGSMINSNTSGTLYLQTPQQVSMGDQLVYSSSQNGDSDSFTLVYAVDPNGYIPEGQFNGRIVFTVRSSGDSSMGDQVLLNVTLHQEAQGSVVISGSRQRQEVQINEAELAESNADFVKVKISGSTRREIKIYQELIVWPSNAQAADIPPGALEFYGSGDLEGVRQVSPTPMSTSRELVYSGVPSEQDVAFFYQFNPERVGMLEPGNYQGKIKFTVESGADIEEFVLDLKCQIQPIFTMSIKLPAQGVSFPSVLPNSPPSEVEVLVSVKTNLHKPYQVSQEMVTMLANEKGDRLKKGYFTQRVEIVAGQKGKTKYDEFGPVEEGDHPVFSSDAKGSPTEFKVIYRLQGYPDIVPGNYAAPIKFSLNQN